MATKLNSDALEVLRGSKPYRELSPLRRKFVLALLRSDEDWSAAVRRVYRVQLVPQRVWELRQNKTIQSALRIYRDAVIDRITTRQVKKYVEQKMQDIAAQLTAQGATL